MTLTPDDIIKEAERTVQAKTQDTFEKKASEVATDMMNQRDKVMLEKLAEESPLVKLAMESEEDIFTTKDFKVNSCLEKVALAIPSGLGQAAGGFLQKMMANNGARNIAIGAGTGALAGAVAGDKDRKFSSAIKGGLLGGVAGAGVSAFKSLTPAANTSRRAQSIIDRYSDVTSRTRSVNAGDTNTALGKIRGALGNVNERASKITGIHTDRVGGMVQDARMARATGNHDIYEHGISQAREALTDLTHKATPRNMTELINQREIQKTFKGGRLTRLREALVAPIGIGGGTVGKPGSWRSSVHAFLGGEGKAARTEEALHMFKGGPLGNRYQANVENRLTSAYEKGAKNVVGKFEAKETAALAGKFKNPEAITDAGLENSIRGAANPGPGAVSRGTGSNYGNIAVQKTVPTSAPGIHEPIGLDTPIGLNPHSSLSKPVVPAASRNEMSFTPTTVNSSASASKKVGKKGARMPLPQE